MIIGITGKSGSGKTTLAKKYVEKGYIHVPIDEIGHQVISENKYILEGWFGTSDRKELGELVFNNRHKYEDFSNAIWKQMEKKIDRILEENENVILDFILLPHTKYWKDCYKVLVKCPDYIRKQRVLERDNISEEYYNLREQHSVEYNEQEMNEIINGEF